MSVWATSKDRHNMRAKPSDFKWWRLSKPKPRLKFKPRKSWYNLVNFLFYKAESHD